MKGLVIEAARAFVLTAELRSFTRAAEALNTTQAAVSLKIKRLEDGIGRKLLERTPRLVRLSADGDAFLPRARALVAAHEEAIACFDLDPRHLVVGISHHIVGAELPLLLKRLGNAEPGLVLEMRIATSRDTLADFERGLLDAAIVLRHDNIRRDGEKILEETFGWMATPDFEYRKGEPLRLATQAAPCKCAQHGYRCAGCGTYSVDGSLRWRRRHDGRRSRFRRAGRRGVGAPGCTSGNHRYRAAGGPASAAVA